MKHLAIKNFGPLESADIDFGSTNLIIGMQSSGKSCVMMIACFCSWVEKRIALRQSAKEFMQGTQFIDMLTSYYHSKGYVHEDTCIEYESEFMRFKYDNKVKAFTQEWNEDNRWNYKRPKVSYIPAERNMIAIVDNWTRLETSYYNIIDFKIDWDTARRHIRKEADILGTGISYEYDENTNADSITTTDGKRLELVNSSSGVQSLIPQFIQLNYLRHGIYEAEKEDKERTFAERQFTNNLLEIIYKRNFRQETATANSSAQCMVHKNGKDYVFYSEKDALDFNKDADRLLYTDHTEVFLEEPESNLFPPTQLQLMNWIVDMAEDGRHRNFFLIATHSPYILSHLLQEDMKDFRLLLTRPTGRGGYSIKTANEEEIQQVYDNGSDAFFNFDAFLDL